MSQEQQHDTPQDDDSSCGNPHAQQQQHEHPEGHGGRGAESVMKQLREWEDRRASHSGGKRHPGAA